MARDVPTLGERLRGLSPHQRERDLVMVVLAELIDEQNGLLHTQNELLADIRNGRRSGTEGDLEAGPAPSGDAPEESEEGGARVRLREPEVPPPDEDGDGPGDAQGDGEGSNGTVATEATGTPDAPARRAPARKAAAKKAASKKAPAPSGDRQSREEG